MRKKLTILFFAILLCTVVIACKNSISGSDFTPVGRDEYESESTEVYEISGVKQEKSTSYDISGRRQESYE